MFIHMTQLGLTRLRLEHSHEPILTSVRASLNVNNPNGIVDPVFGLLGNAAAAGGAGKITVSSTLLPHRRVMRMTHFRTWTVCNKQQLIKPSPTPRLLAMLRSVVVTS